MSALIEVESLDTLEKLDFKWVKKRGVGGKTKEIQFYESFTFDGMDYTLHDCVFMYKKDEPAPYIGKLVKIWENEKKSKKIKVQWFFRPCEISLFLGDAEVMENELFLASGVGSGLVNINPLEAIAGKCNVVCISKDSRNLQPSAEEVQMADYVFYRTFDVKSKTISNNLGDTVGGLDVKYVFNRTESLRPLDVRSVNLNIFPTGKNVVACGQTPNAEGKNPLLQLKDAKGEIEVCLLGKQGINANEVLEKQGGLLGECSSRGNVNFSNVGNNIILEKENMPGDKAMKSPVIRVKVEEGVKKTARDSGDDLDNSRSKKAKLDGPVSSLEVKDVKDATELKKNLNGSGEDADLSNKKSSILAQKFSKTSVLAELTPICGHDEDLNALQGNQSKGNNFVSREKPECTLAKDLVGPEKGNELGGNLSACMERRSKINVAPMGKQSKGNNFVSREKSESTLAKDLVCTEKGNKLGENLSARMVRPSKINVAPIEVERLVASNETPKSTPKSGSNKDFHGSRQATKFVNASTSRTLKRSADLSKEKSNTLKMSNYENMDELGDDSSPLGGPLFKKGKVDDSINKVSEKACPNDIKNSPRLAANDNTAKSNLGNNALKEHFEGGPSKKGKFDDSNCKNNAIENVMEKTCFGEKKGSPKVVVLEKSTTLKLDKGASKENFNDKVGKNSKNNLHSKCASKVNYNDKAGKSSKHNLHAPSIVECEGGDGKVGSRIFEVTRRPIVEKKSNWMKLPWESKMKTAHDQERLVLLQNLDPEYTSGEVEDIVWHAFKEECTAKLVQQTATSSPYSGQAFVIFKAKETVDGVVKKLEGGCLMLPNKRPLVVRIIDFPKFLEKKTFVGHLAIDKARRQREMKEAVATSHYSQNNTVEYEMAMAWCLLQSKSDSWWDKLYKQHKNEIEKLTDNLKSK